jgi:RNA polymerase sigma-32 factor
MAQLDDMHKDFIKAAKNAPYLERDEERELIVAWIAHKNQNALHRLAEAHMRLVISMAAKFRNYGLSQSDLIQEGHVGLLEAAMRFQPEREVRFSTYASWWIRAAIQDFVLKNWSIVRGGTSSGQKALFFNLRRIRAQIAQTTGSDSNLHKVYMQIATQVGVQVSDVTAMAARLSGADMSMNSPVSNSDDEGASERGDFFLDPQPLQDEIVGELIDSDRRMNWLHSAMSGLNDRETKIIQQRHLKENPLTLESLGEQMGISKERVRQIETRALEKLKSALLSLQPNPAISMF